MKIFSLGLLLSVSINAMITDDLVKRFTVTDGDTVYVNPAIARLLKNDSLFSDEAERITLKDAVDTTQKTWLIKDWDHSGAAEKSADQIATGKDILSGLSSDAYNEDICPDAMIAHGGVLPSAVKMLLAANRVYEKHGVTRLYVVNGNEDFNLRMIQKSSVLDYMDLCQQLEFEYPALTEEDKPKNGADLVKYLLPGLNRDGKLAVEFIDKSKLSDFAKRVEVPTSFAVCASKPQLEAHMLTFAQLSKENSNFQVVSGVTAGEQDWLEKYYDSQSDLEKYTFERNNFARVLWQLQNYLD